MSEREKLLAAMDMWAEYLNDEERGVMSFPQWLNARFERYVGGAL